MKQVHRLTGFIEREGDGYVSLCPELDLASQGETIEEARRNLIEALELFFETADPSEILQREHGERMANGMAWAIRLGPISLKLTSGVAQPYPILIRMGAPTSSSITTADRPCFCETSQRTLGTG